MHIFAFESYGVKARIESSSRELLDKAIAVVNTSLLGRLSTNACSADDHLITLRYRNGKIWMVFDGEDEGVSATEIGWLNYLDTRIRLLIGEHAPDFVFVHSGAVVWHGRGILCPGDSFTGKSTLVAEFVKRGAAYLSDEYAILDEDANLHSFPRNIALRPEDDPGRRYFISPESLGAEIPKKPVTPALILLAPFHPQAGWVPEILSPGQGILGIIPHALSIRAKTRLTLSVLKRLSERAIIVHSQRGDASSCTPKILDFVDKLIISAKIT